MRNLKKALSLSLALVLSLVMAVPAFADGIKSYSANGYTDPVAENVNFSVAPIGAATIRWEVPGGGTTGPEYTAYVFDQDCVVTRKDGLPLTDFVLDDCADRYWVNIGNKNFPYADVDVAGISADFEHYWLFQFGTKDSGDKDDWSPYMMSKKGLDSLSIKYDDAPSYVAVVEYRTLSAQPTTPSEPQQPGGPVVENIPASGTAKASTQTVTVDGKKMEFQMYALLDANGNGTNYVKLRDMAHVLNGTKAQFAVGYSEETGITVTSGQPYQATGSEMSTPFSGDRAYTGGGQSVQVNGKAVTMTAITLLDDSGGGYNYFKLRDLGAALGFNVDWSAEKGIFVETDKPYGG